MQFTLVLNDKCNLSCEYCCVLDSLNQGNEISLEDTYSFLDWQLKLYPKDEEHTIEFFGGEPTINWSSIKEIFKYLDINYSDYNLSYRIYTNCVFNSKVKNDLDTWKKFDDIICSIDGDFEDNIFRTKSKNTHKHIIENYQYLLNNLSTVGVAFVVHPESNLKGVYEYFKSMGTRYYHFELATLWKDNKDNGITNEYLFNFCTFIYENVLIQNLNNQDNFFLFSIPRELLSSKYFFINKTRKSCFDEMRSLSPKGNIYFCRDLAVSEDHLFKMNQDTNMIFRENSFKPFNIKGLQLDKESNSYLSSTRNYDNLTSCPVKSFEFEHFTQVIPSWILDDDFQKIILFPIFEIMLETFTLYTKDSIKDKEFLKDHYNKIEVYGELLKYYDKNILQK